MKNDGEAPLPMRMSALLYYDNSLLQIAGYRNEDPCLPYLYRYSLTELKWDVISNKTSRFECRDLCQGFIHNHQLFILYGWLTQVDEGTKDVLKIDLRGQNSSWESLALFPSLASSEYSLVKVENTIYHFGGDNFLLGQYTNKFSKIDLETFTVVEINDNLAFPKQRTLHSMVLINQKIFLFGGINNDEVFNDLWSFDLLYYNWSQVPAKGSIPSPRYLHAAAAEGNAFVIWGGQDKSSLKDDFFIFNSLTNIWIELATSSNKPKPAKGACLAVRDFQVYLYGGRTTSETSNELWKYHFGTNSFELLSNSESYKVAYSQCWADSQLFYTSLGTFDDEGPSGIIKVFNFSSSTWSDFHNHGNAVRDSSQSVQVNIGDKLISIGGHSWGQEIIKRVFIFGPGTQSTVYPGFDLAIIGSASVYYKKKLFVFGGAIQTGTNFLQTTGHNLLFYIDLEEICGKGDCEALCPPGTFIHDQGCESCPAGTFNEKFDSFECTECKAGFFNQYRSSSNSHQCLPCREGSYNSEKGAKECKVCPQEKYCPVGSTWYYDKKNNQHKKSVQPPLYGDPDLFDSTLIYQTSVSIPLALIMIILFSFKKFSPYAKKLDIFDDKHENPDTEFIVKKKTKVGACFSILFVIGALALTCNSVLEYFKANIQETKALVTLVVLEPEAKVLTADDFLVQVLLYSYGGECELEINKTIRILSQNIYYSNQIISCDRLENNFCRIRIVSNDVVINTGAYFTINLTEFSSFASGIEVNLTSSSSIPNQISSVFSLIYSLENSVFIGPVPSEFYFQATPSLFKSESSRWESKATGYHISEKNTPKFGSQFRTQDFSSVSSLNLKVFIEKTSTGLLTQRKLKQNFIYFAGSLLGSFSGLFGIVGFIMKYFELVAKHLLIRISKVKLNKIANIGTNFNSSTNVKIDENHDESMVQN